MPERLRHPTAGLAGVMAVMLAALFVALALISAVVHNTTSLARFDLGTVPAWVAAIASVMTLFGVIAAWLSLRANLANRQDDEASIARLLSPRLSASVEHGRITVTVTFRNASTLPFHQIAVHGVGYGELGCQQYMQHRDRERKAPQRMYLSPNEDFVSVWVVPDPRVLWDLDDGRDLNVLFEYMDGNGRRWNRYTHTEPKRVLPPKRSAHEVSAFENSMRARTPNGASVVDVDLWEWALDDDSPLRD